VGSLVVSLSLALSLRMQYAIKAHVLAVYITGETDAQHELEARQARWKARYEQFQKDQKALVQRAKTQAWQPALTSLASVIPQQAWLTQLGYQQSKLVLTGYAASLPALSAFAEALKQLPGFILGPTGQLQQDSQGKWTYSFTLKRQE